jgi:hypothetical protein
MSDAQPRFVGDIELRVVRRKQWIVIEGQAGKWMSVDALQYRRGEIALHQHYWTPHEIVPPHTHGPGGQPTIAAVWGEWQDVPIVDAA